VDEEQARRLADKAKSRASAAAKGALALFSWKGAAIVVAGAGILGVAAVYIRTVYRDTATGDVDTVDFDEETAFPQKKRDEMDRSALSSDDLRHMVFQQDYDVAPAQRGPDSLKYLKTREEKKEAGMAPSPSPLPQGGEGKKEEESKKVGEGKKVKAQKQEAGPPKPRPQLKGFGEGPRPGSITGFRMKTQFGGLQQKAAPQKPSLGSTGSSGFGKKPSSAPVEDEEDSEEDACAQACKPSSAVSGISKETACMGDNRAWVDNACMDMNKFQACAAKNPACQE